MKEGCGHKQIPQLVHSVSLVWAQCFTVTVQVVAANVRIEVPAGLEEGLEEELAAPGSGGGGRPGRPSGPAGERPQELVPDLIRFLQAHPEIKAVPKLVQVRLSGAEPQTSAVGSQSTSKGPRCGRCGRCISRHLCMNPMQNCRCFQKVAKASASCSHLSKSRLPSMAPHQISSRKRPFWQMSISIALSREACSSMPRCCWMAAGVL